MNIKISIVGQGYVGLPLAITSSKAGYEVIGIDSNDQKVSQLNNYQSPIEDYVKRCRENAIGTFAVLVEDNWYEKGEMGWFGITHNENPNWSSEFQKLLDSVDDDTLISLYDCHI